MKKLLLFFILIFNVFGADSYQLKDKIGIMKSLIGNFEIKVEDLGTLYQFTLSADTVGWMAIGFDSGFAMKNGEIIICYSENNTAHIEHHYGTSSFKHKSIQMLMGDKYPQDALNLLSYQHSNGRSTYVFTRKKNLSGKYFKDLYSKKEIELLYAYRKDSNIKKKHSKAATLMIKLP